MHSKVSRRIIYLGFAYVCASTPLFCFSPSLLMAPLLLRLPYTGKVMKFNFNVVSDSLRASIKGLADVVVCPYS